MKSKVINLNSQSFVDARINRAKFAYTTRCVKLKPGVTLLKNATPKIGDLVLARVERLGQHKRIELVNGRRARMFVGDEIVVVYGNRYAPDQFEAMIPDTLAPCHLVAAGGVAAQVLSKHSMMKRPTEITPLGILGDMHGKAINLTNFALKEINTNGQHPITVVVTGTTMNAGKTTTAANLIKGLSSSGLKVGSAKITGTGAGGDVWFMKDAGAEPALDFVDAGFPSTYRIEFEQVEEILGILTSHLSKAGVDAIVLEVADGLYQEETAKLLSSQVFKDSIDAMLFTARDAMGGKAGLEWLRKYNIPVFALSGALTSSLLAMREAQEVVDIQVLDSDDLKNPEIADRLSNWLIDQDSTKSPRLQVVK